MLTSKQYKLLMRIILFDGAFALDYSKYQRCYNYLSGCGYILKVRDSKCGFIVTEEGLVEMERYRDDKIRFRITTAISFVALMASILSIFTQTPQGKQLLETLTEILQK